MRHSSIDPAYQESRPWNEGRLLGPSRRSTYSRSGRSASSSIRTGNCATGRCFDHAIDSKLRGRDVVKVRVDDIVTGGSFRHRAIVVQQKTKRPMQFELVGTTLKPCKLGWSRGGTLDDFVFPSRNDYTGHMSTRRYARLVHEWVVGIGLQPQEYGTHSLLHTKASIIYKATGNCARFRSFLGMPRWKAWFATSGGDLDDALELAERQSSRIDAWWRSISFDEPSRRLQRTRLTRRDAMKVDYVIVGGGSAGAALAARLSEDARVTVALLEAGERPPERAAMPAACGSLQLDPETDWMLTADAGRAGLGLKGRRMPVPRGKMLGGSSGINYMAWVHGHPGDFDRWASLGAKGWAHADVLPYFLRAEDVTPTNEAAIDQPVRGTGGPVGVSVRSPVIPASRDFVAAAASTGMTQGDYNGRDRLDPAGVTSLFQTSTRNGRRSSTYHAYLAGEVEARANLTIVTGAHAMRVVLDNEDRLRATGVEYRDATGELRVVSADREVILSAGAIGSPHLLMLSGIGPRRELEAAGVRCRLDNAHVGKHLKDHLQCGMFFAAPGIGMSISEAAISMGPDALRAPAGPLPADPAGDADMPEELVALKVEAERRLGEWATTGHGLVSSSLYDAVSFYSTGLGDKHSHDAQIAFIPCTYDLALYENQLNIDLTKLSADAATLFATTAENVTFLPNPVLPHSEGEIVLTSADASEPPTIAMNYFADPHDLRVMVAVMRRTLAIAAAWPGPHKLGPWLIPPDLARVHGYREGEPPSDALLESMALHFSTTVYHLCCTCRIGDVVDPELHVIGVRNLRVADASVMPDIVSGNTNAAAIMIGERAADLIKAGWFVAA